MLLLNAFVRYGATRQCPTDPTLAQQCQAAQRFSNLVFVLSLGLYSIGVVFAFLA
jgi:hypothetical protein